MAHRTHGINGKKSRGSIPSVYSVCSVGTDWKDTPVHFIDFEGNSTSGIIEFGVVTLRGGEIAETRTRL